MWFGYTSIISLTEDGNRKNVGVILTGASNDDFVWVVDEAKINKSLKLKFDHLKTKYSSYAKVEKRVIVKIKANEQPSMFNPKYNELAMIEIHKVTLLGDIRISLPIWTPYGSDSLEKTAEDRFNEFVVNQDNIKKSVLKVTNNEEYFLLKEAENPLQPCIHNKQRGGRELYVGIYNNVCNNRPTPLFRDKEQLEKDGLPQPPEECKNCVFSQHWNNDEEVEKSTSLFVADMDKHPWWVYAGNKSFYQIKQKRCMDCGTYFVPVNTDKDRTEIEIYNCIKCKSHNVFSTSIMDLKIAPPRSNKEIMKSAEGLSTIRSAFRKTQDRIKEEDDAMVFDDYRLFSVEVTASKSDREMSYEINAKSAIEAKEKAETIYNNEGIVFLVYASVLGEPVEEDDFDSFRNGNYNKSDCSPRKEDIPYMQTLIKDIDKKYGRMAKNNDTKKNKIIYPDFN